MKLLLSPQLHNTPPARDTKHKPSPEQRQNDTSNQSVTSGIQPQRKCHSQIVNVQPTPITLIRGTTAALLPAEHRYCTIYFPLITSDRRSGIASTHVISSLTRNKEGKLTSSIRIQPIKRPHQPHASEERRNDRYSHPPSARLQRPPVNQHRNGQHPAQRRQPAVQSILRETQAPAASDIPLHGVIG